MSKITSKQINIIDNVNFNNKEITNAVIDAAKNQLIGIGTDLVAGDNILIEGATISAIVPTQVSELENDSGYTTVADVNSEIIALSSELDVALNINSYQAVNNNAITAGIENSKVDVVEDFVTTLPSTVTANQNYLNITNNKIYKAVKRKELSNYYTNTNLTLLSDGSIKGFGTHSTQQTKLTYNSNAWSYIFPIVLMFNTTDWFIGTNDSTSRIFTLNRTDDDSTLFAIDLIKNRMLGNNNRYIKFSTINRDGTIKEVISSNNIIGNANSIIEIRITKSCYVEVLVNNKVNSIKYMDSLNGSTITDDDFYYTLPVIATIENLYNDTIKISQLFGLNSYMSYGYMGPSGSARIVYEYSNYYQLDEGTDLVKNKLIVNSTEKKLYEYDGSQLNEIGGNEELPSQVGQTGKFLTTDGSVASWANIPSVATKILNVVEVGNLTRNGAKISGFSSSNYIKIGSSYEDNMVAFNFSENIIPLMAIADSWEIMIKFKTSNLNNQIILGQEANYTTPQIEIYNSKINICLSFDGSTWAYDEGYDTLLANMTYYISLKYTGTSYIVTLYNSSKTQISTYTINDSTKIYNEGIFRFGSDENTNAFEGEIDFNETHIKIDGNFKWKGVIEIGSAL